MGGSIAESIKKKVKKTFGFGKPAEQQEEHAQGAGAPQAGNQGNIALIDDMQEVDVEDAKLSQESAMSVYADRLRNNVRHNLLGHTIDNSAQYTNVNSQLDALVTLLSKPISHEKAAFDQEFQQIVDQYISVKNTCEEYIEKTENAHSLNGNARHKMVSKISAQADMELGSLVKNRQLFENVAEGSTWSRTIAFARTEHFDLQQSGEQLDKGGAGASVRLSFGHGENKKWFTKDVRNTNDLKESIDAANKSGNEVLTMQLQFLQKDNNITMLEDFKSISSLADFYKLSPDKQEELKKLAVEKIGAMNSSMAENHIDAKYQFDVNKPVDFIVLVGPLSKNFTAFDVNNQQAGIGQNRNLNNRNTATSRLADLLGIGSMVARSRRADLTTPEGEKMEGSVMDQAKGTGWDDLRGRIHATLTGEATRQLMCMQMLDTICGQVDRHVGNFNYNQNAAGQITGLQGYDNDAAFGNITDMNVNHRELSSVDVNNVPVIDKQLASRIRSITKEMLQYALCDILEKDEIDSLYARLEYVKNYIDQLQEQNESALLDDAGWEHAGSILNSQYQAARNGKMYKYDRHNYYTKLMGKR